VRIAPIDVMMIAARIVARDAARIVARDTVVLTVLRRLM
jgi:hypothetical protein